MSGTSRLFFSLKECPRTLAVGYVVRPAGLDAEHRAYGAAAGEEVADLARVYGHDAVVVLVEADVGVLASRRTVAVSCVGNIQTHRHYNQLSQLVS